MVYDFEKEEEFVPEKNYYTDMINNNSKKKHVIPLLDKEWYSLINSIYHMDSANAKVMLEEMYEYITLLFNIPKKIMKINDYGDKELMINPEWFEARDWVDYHAGWVIDYNKSNFNAFHHPIRKLNDKFCFNAELWKEN